MITQARILELLDYVKDPEIPVIKVLELGVVRGVARVRSLALIRHDRP